MNELWEEDYDALRNVSKALIKGLLNNEPGVKVKAEYFLSVVDGSFLVNTYSFEDDLILKEFVKEE